MDNKIFNLDYQVITNKLSPLAEVPLTNESMVSDDYDSNTKEFLSFITETIQTAKSIEKTSIDNNAMKINALVKDANEVITKFFENNSLVSYYNDILSESLKKISDSIKSVKDSFNIDDIKSSIIDVLQILNDSIQKKNNEEFNSTLTAFKEEIKTAVDVESEKSRTAIERKISESIDSYIENNKGAISSQISSSLKILLCNSISVYAKTLNETFTKNFSLHIESNFKNKAKQSSVVNSIQKSYNGLFTPFVYMAKLIKYAKNSTVVVGTKVKTKTAKVFSNPIARLKNTIKTKLEEKKKEIRKGFLKATRFIRRPKKMLQLKFGRKFKAFKNSTFQQTTSKYGLLAGLVKLVQIAINKKHKAFRTSTTMNFKPFKIGSVITSSVEDYIDTLAEHSGIIRNNLQIYLDKDIVESYNSRDKVGGKLKVKAKKKKGGSDEGGGFGLFSFLLSLPRLIKTIKRIWRFVKKAWKFVKKVGRFLKKAVKFIAKALKAIAKFTAKVAKGLWHGIKNIKKIKNVGKYLKNPGKYLKNTGKFLKNTGKYLKNLKNTGKYLRNAGKAIKNIKNAGKYIKTAGNAVKAFAKNLGGKAAAQVAAKGATKGFSKFVPFLSFAVDGAFAAMEAQDTEAMGALYGIDPSEVGVQQKTAYIIAGTLAGGTSLVDADWSDPKSVGMAALDTAMTVGKFAAIGSIIPGVGTAIGAAVGLVVALVGTQRLAKGINWVCDKAKAAWNGIKSFAKGIWNGAKKAAKFIGKAMTYINPILLVTMHGKEIWNGAKNLAKKFWGKAKGLGKKFKDKLSSIKGKLFSKIGGLKDKLKGSLEKIGSKLKGSIKTVGKTLLSNLFPIYGIATKVKDLASKTVAKVADKIKNSIVGRATKAVWNVITGKDKDVDAKLQENSEILKSIEQKRKDLDIVINEASTFARTIKKIQEDKKQPDSEEDDGDGIDEDIINSIGSMTRMSGMIDSLFSTKPPVAPIPVEVKPPELKATAAADHWAEQPA